MEWMILPFKRYAEFTGRSRRKEFWMFQLLNILIVVVIMLLIFGGVPWAALSDPAAATAGFGAISWLGFGLMALWVLAAFIPSIAVTVRRLHDRNLSGWWYLGFIIISMIPIVGLLASIAFLVVMALPGTPGENRFGADPKNPSRSEVFA